MQVLKITPRLFMRRFNTQQLFLRNTKFNPTRKAQTDIRAITTSRVYNKKNYVQPYFSDSDDEYDPGYQDKPTSVKTLLYENRDDPLMEHLNAAASIQQVFTFLNKYRLIITHEHLAQAVLVLWDLQKMFQHINVLSNVSTLEKLMNDYVSQLTARGEFEELLKTIEERVDEFDADALSCTLMYLNKIGVPLKNESLQVMVDNLKKKLGDSSLFALSRFITTVFNDSNVGSYYLVQDVIPRIFNEIETCETSDDFKLLTICLNNLNKIINNNILEKYKNKAEELLDKGVISVDEPSCILKIILFLNYPQWRERNTILMSRCMKLFKGHFNLLNAEEILIIFDIFHRIQEPADILTELQRHARKFLHELEEEMYPLLDVRLKLLTCITCFSPASMRHQYESVVSKYMTYDLKGENFLELNKTMQYIKISNPLVCKTFWDKLLYEMENNVAFRQQNLLKICYSYMNFSQHANYRHFQFEKRVNQWLEGEIEQSVGNLIPSYYSGMATFILAYGLDISIVNYMVNKLHDDWEQLDAVDCQNIAKSMAVGRHVTQNPHLKQRYVDKLNRTLNKCVTRLTKGEITTNDVNVLLKSYIYRNKIDGDSLDDLLQKYENMEYMSSKLIKNVTYCLNMNNALVPAALEKMVDYVIKYKENVMAFNAEKVAYLCYYLGYTPNNYKEFCKTLIDMIIRDQDKLTALCYIQSCLTLCYFNALPHSFVKQVFNMDFLEKLDQELLNCYSKDFYPARVRDKLMQLNRAVCVDYPETNVPWFHEKYIVEITKKKELEKEPEFTYAVREYLVKLFQKPTQIIKHVVTPYGYHIDFVLQFANNNENAESKRFAILLLPERAFTTYNVQPKGYYQVKERHLEMFGYQVKYLLFNDWKNLIYGIDKMNYIKNLFMPKVLNVIQVNR